MKRVTSNENTQPLRPALSPEARANQLVALAYDLAEKQLREGTASSQVITEFLKLGSHKAELEREKLQRENELLRVKAEKIQSEERSEELFNRAIKAMQRYSGRATEEEIDEYDDY